jgi:tetratricopeptide (TPR) repeat protein
MTFLKSSRTSSPTVERPLWQVWAVVAVVGLLAYSNSFSAALGFDNRFILLQDPRIRSISWHSLHAIFTEDYWRPTFPSNLYRPFATLSYLVNYRILGNGTNPAGYHAVNLALHLANAGWVVALTTRFARSRVLALVAGLIFVAHPAAVESVTNVVGRADLLAGFFVLAGLYFHAANRPLVFVAASIAGVLCKENAVVLLPAAVALDWIMDPPIQRRPWTGYWTLLPALGVFCGVQLTIGSSSPVSWQYFVDNPIARAGWGQGLLTAVAVQVRYLGLLLWPAQLSCDYSYNQIRLVGTGDGMQDGLSAAGLLFAATSAWAVWRWRSQRLLLLGAVMYLLYALPTANVVKVIGSIMAERFLYLPLVGFAWVIAGCAGMVSHRRGGQYFVLAGAFVAAAALGARSYRRNQDWQSELSLWASATVAAPDSFKTHAGLANAISESDESEPTLDRAIGEAKTALAILNRPEIDSAVERRDPSLFIDLAKYYQRKAALRAAAQDSGAANQCWQQSIALLERARTVNRWIDHESRRIQLAQGVAPERIRTIGREDLFHLLAVAELKTGRLAEAVDAGMDAVRLNPFDPAGFEFLAACENRLHHSDAAILGLYLAIFANSHYAAAWDELSALYSRRSPPVTPIWTGAGDSRTLESENPALRADLLNACRRYAQLLRRQAYPEEAAAFSTFAIRAFHCSPTDLKWNEPNLDPLLSLREPSG